MHLHVRLLATSFGGKVYWGRLSIISAVCVAASLQCLDPLSDWEGQMLCNSIFVNMELADSEGSSN